MPEVVGTVAGVWQRQWEEDPLGDQEGADRDTLVLWTQSCQSGAYVDLRLTINSPGRDVRTARECGAVPNPSALAGNGTRTLQRVPNFVNSQENITALLEQKSFAGVLEFKLGDTTRTGDALKEDSALAELAACGDPSAIPLCTCFWRRDLDYQPPNGGLDIGVCASGPPSPTDDSILLRETGDDASYAEGWLRLPGSEKGPFLALKLVSENGYKDARDGFWVRAGSRFAYAIGRPKTVEAARQLSCPEACVKIAEYVGKGLSEAIEMISKGPKEMLNLAFTYVAVAGDIDKERKWEIRHGTNPELVGCILVGDPNKDKFCCSVLNEIRSSGADHVSEQQVEQVIPLSEGGFVTRVWEVIERVDCVVPFTESES